MRRGFWNGVMAGGLIGAVVGMLFAPQLHTGARHRVIEGGKRIGRRAQQLWRRGREQAEDAMDEMKE